MRGRVFVQCIVRTDAMRLLTLVVFGYIRGDEREECAERYECAELF